jgi:hypothetical protein
VKYTSTHSQGLLGCLSEDTVQLFSTKLSWEGSLKHAAGLLLLCVVCGFKHEKEALTWSVILSAWTILYLQNIMGFFTVVYLQFILFSGMKFLLFSLLVHSLTFLYWISSFNLAMSMARVLNFVAGLNFWGGDQPLCFDLLSSWSLISIL